MSCEKKKQRYDQYGDPINDCSKGFDSFKDRWEKKYGKSKSYGDRESMKSFYDDFKHNSNQSEDSYFKEIEK